MSKKTKTISVILCITIVLFLGVSCSKENISNKTAINGDMNTTEKAGISAGTINIVESGITNSSISTNTINNDTMFKSISFDSILGADRESRTTNSSLIISGNACRGSDEFAVCIVTVTSIDKDGCNSERGTYVPVTLRIDTVIDSTSAFSLGSGDTVTVSEYSTWFKNEEGYTVSYHDGIIPITEEGSQYIISIYEVSENVAKLFWSGLKYRVEALTIPISPNHEMSDLEIYSKLKLPDDVAQCSKELIDYFMNK